MGAVCVSSTKCNGVPVKIWKDYASTLITVSFDVDLAIYKTEIISGIKPQGNSIITENIVSNYACLAEEILI